MQLLVQPELAERVVFQTTRRDGFLRSHYEREFSSGYVNPAGRLRDVAFAELHQRWFEVLGWNRFLRDRIAECTHMAAAAMRIFVRSVAGRGTQKVELFGKPGGYTVVAGVAPAAFDDTASLTYWMRHEFAHVDDMLNPAFKYDLDLQPAGASPAARDLGRDRHAVLWAMSIDARLAAFDGLARTLKPRRRAEFARAWGLTDSTAIAETFEGQWARFAAARPTHRELVALAENDRWIRGSWTAASTISARRPHTPGGRCPACRFPTHDWATPSLLEPIAVDIADRLPGWKLEDGLCGRCAEVYSISPGRLPVGG